MNHFVLAILVILLPSTARSDDPPVAKRSLLSMFLPPATPIAQARPSDTLAYGYYKLRVVAPDTAIDYKLRTIAPSWGLDSELPEHYLSFPDLGKRIVEYQHVRQLQMHYSEQHKRELDVELKYFGLPSRPK